MALNSESVLMTATGADYELIDSGEGEKLERFGKFLLSRPDPQVLWRKNLSEAEWRKAQGSFSRDEKKADWSRKKDLAERWPIDFAGLRFWIKPTAFKHVGLFPEQSSNWHWLAEHLKGTKDVEVLNLFGYTGGATLTCAAMGAKVVHVDGSKTAISWARENAELSRLQDKPVRWILDDAAEFVRREIRRGRKYQGIVMDPPAFGHGPDNQLWKIEEHYLPLFEDCLKILADDAIFFLINGYSAGYSALAYRNGLLALVKKRGGTIENGELAIQESGSSDMARLLPCGIFARWSK